MILPFLNHPDLAIINVLNDMPFGRSCQQWGMNGDSRIPIIINEHTGIPYPGAPGKINNWFAGSGDWIQPGSSPWYILIDSQYKYVYLSPLNATHSEIVNEINNLLGN